MEGKRKMKDGQEPTIRKMELLAAKRNGEKVFTTMDECFYSSVVGYKISEAYNAYGLSGLLELRNNETDCFFGWNLNSSGQKIINEQDSEWMQIYYEKNWEETKDRGYWDEKIAYERVTHGKDVSEIIGYFAAKGVPTEVLSNLEKDVLKFRKDNPMKDKWREV